MKRNSGNPSINQRDGSPQPPRTRASADTALVSARVGRRSAKWALSYLRGRAAAYIRGSVTAANVNGCVALALRYGASLDDARRVLAEHSLRWDAEEQEVVREETARERHDRLRQQDRRDIQSTPDVLAPQARKMA